MLKPKFQSDLVRVVGSKLDRFFCRDMLIDRFHLKPEGNYSF